MRRAERADRLADDINEDIAESERLAEEIEKLRRLGEDIGHRIVCQCEVLSSLWRELMIGIADDLESGKDIDLRGFGEKLIATADKTISAYAGAQKRVNVLRAVGCSIQDGDLQLAIREINEFRDWLMTWPSSDDSCRREALSQIQDRACCA
jgi:hypothetical protein